MGLRLRDVSHEDAESLFSLCLQTVVQLFRFNPYPRTQEQVLRIFSKSIEVIVWEGERGCLGI